MKNPNIKKITLVSTYDCNLKCLYCYETHKNTNNMSFETAKAVIDSEMKRFSDDTSVKIEIIGGEPFLPCSFELFRNVAEYVKRHYSDRKVEYIVTTNGTLVHGEIQSFLLENSDKIVLSLSLDGRKRTHDLNRPMKNGQSSFDSIDIAFFQKYPCKVNAKMTVSPITLKYLADDIYYISEELGFIPTVTLASGISWEKDFSADEMIEQLELLVDYYSKNDTLELPLMLNIDIENIFAKPDKFCRPCGAGETTRAFCPDCISPDGSITWYPCQGLAPITLGKEKSVQFQNCTFENFILHEPCGSCKFRPVCHSCQATNFGITGDVGKQSPVMCLMNRLCALATSKIMYNRMNLKSADNMTPEQQTLLKAIYIIQTEIMDNNKHEFLWKYEM